MKVKCIRGCGLGNQSFLKEVNLNIKNGLSLSLPKNKG